MMNVKSRAESFSKAPNFSGNQSTCLDTLKKVSTPVQHIFSPSKHSDNYNYYKDKS
jgi:hypothetical protein